jgi:hypothetical protein
MPRAATELILDARSHLRDAVALWNLNDLTQMDISEDLLHQALKNVSETVAFLRSGYSHDPVRLAQLLGSLDMEIAQAVRRCDAAAAFYKGLALRSRGSMSAYGADGMPRPNAVVECELHG